MINIIFRAALVFMNRYFIAALLVLAVVASGCTSSTAPDQAQDPETEPADAPDENKTSYQISYTSSGFTPSEVKVNQGDTVTWTDEGGGNMWVASDRHPTHTQHDGTSTSEHCEYPRDSERQERIENPFDSCASVDTFSYTFNQTGEWSYHNHENPLDSGTVTVR
jgi:plastocyanin